MWADPRRQEVERLLAIAANEVQLTRLRNMRKLMLEIAELLPDGQSEALPALEELIARELIHHCNLYETAADEQVRTCSAQVAHRTSSALAWIIYRPWIL